MKKLVSLIAALILATTCAMAENPASYAVEPAEAAPIVTLSFEGNATTGYEWNAMILGGDSVEIDENASGYVADPAPEELCGVGGKQYFTLKALKPGETIIRFVYARAWEPDFDQQVIVLATVTEDLMIHTTDVTASGVYDGVVSAIDMDEHAVTLQSDRLGEVIARFDSGESMPVEGEHIVIYTNGTMTMSLPPIVNVIAWAVVPGENAR